MLFSEITVDGVNVNDLPPSSEKRVETKCDMCGKISTTTFANYRRSQDKRGKPGTTFCRGCAMKLSAISRRGKPAHNKGKKLPLEMKGKNHPSWKGGRYVDNHGYILMYTGGDKQASGWNSYKKEHILVVENSIGRCLNKGEIVHHVDGDKQNNDIDNLWLTDSNGHRMAHQSLQELGYEMIRAGIILFDKVAGKYRWGNQKCGM